MSYTARIWQRVEFLNANGVPIAPPIGMRLDEAPRVLALAGEESFVANAVVADDYGKVTLWNDGDGGLADFDLLVFYSDKAVLLELVIDRAGTPTYSTIGVSAKYPLILTSDDCVNAVLTDGSATSMDQIDSIRVKNNVANGVGDANVQLILAT